jgi:hypothetical protein
MPRHYDREDEEDQPIRSTRQQRQSRNLEHLDYSDEESTPHFRRANQSKHQRDHSDSDEDRPIQEQYRPKNSDSFDNRRMKRQSSESACFVPRTLQPTENRMRSSAPNPSSAWSDSRRDSWAEKENTRFEERSVKSKPWTCATETSDKPQPLRSYSQRKEFENETTGTPVEAYQPPERRNKPRPPPKSEYQPHKQDVDNVEEELSGGKPREDPSFLHQHSNHSMLDPEQNDSMSQKTSSTFDTPDDEIQTPPSKTHKTADIELFPTPHHLVGNPSTGAKYGLPFTVPFIHLCPLNGENSPMVQCLIVRERDDFGSKLFPSYSLYLEKKNKLLLVGKKMTFNSTSNYHLFDMSRGSVNTKMSKKSGNYLGKLRAADSNRTEYTIVTAAKDRKEIGAIVFDRNGIVNQLKEGCQPRKMFVMLPEVSSENIPIEHSVTTSVGKKQVSMIDLLKLADPNKIYSSKDPVFERGNYRLNFNGRVTMASVKNFQLSSPSDPENIICQFGKIAEDKFHLDYKAPLNAFQAFCLALCHFDT